MSPPCNGSMFLAKEEQKRRYKTAPKLVTCPLPKILQDLPGTMNVSHLLVNTDLYQYLLRLIHKL